MTTTKQMPRNETIEECNDSADENVNKSQRIATAATTSTATSLHTTTSKTNNNDVCVTCHSTTLRHTKLGNYTTHKFNDLYRELFASFDGINGSVCGSCYKKCYHERMRRGILQRKDRKHLTPSNIVSGVRERRAAATVQDQHDDETENSTSATTTTTSKRARNSSKNNNQQQSALAVAPRVKRKRSVRDTTNTTANDQQHAYDRIHEVSTDDTSRNNKNQASAAQTLTSPRRPDRDQATNQQHKKMVITTKTSTRNVQRSSSSHQYNAAAAVTSAGTAPRSNQQQGEPMVNIYLDFRLLCPNDLHTVQSSLSYLRSESEEEEEQRYSSVDSDQDHDDITCDDDNNPPNDDDGDGDDAIMDSGHEDHNSYNRQKRRYRQRGGSEQSSSLSSHRYDRHSQRIQMIKTSVASVLPVSCLRREIKHELRHLLLVSGEKGDASEKDDNNFGPRFKIDEIKLVERDASGQIIEVDMMDDDDFFMQTPIEEGTRFVVYLRLGTK